MSSRRGGNSSSSRNSTSSCSRAPSPRCVLSFSPASATNPVPPPPLFFLPHVVVRSFFMCAVSWTICWASAPSVLVVSTASARTKTEAPSPAVGGATIETEPPTPDEDDDATIETEPPTPDEDETEPPTPDEDATIETEPPTPDEDETAAPDEEDAIAAPHEEPPISAPPPNSPRGGPPPPNNKSGLFVWLFFDTVLQPPAPACPHGQTPPCSVNKGESGATILSTPSMAHEMSSSTLYSIVCTTPGSTSAPPRVCGLGGTVVSKAISRLVAVPMSTVFFLVPTGGEQDSSPVLS